MRFSGALLLVTLANALAADYAGQWAGAINSKPYPRPILLTVDQSGEAVSGVLTIGLPPKTIPIQKTQIRVDELRVDELRFEVRDELGNVLSFALAFAVLGQPVGDAQVTLQGNVQVGNQVSDTVLYPTKPETIYQSGIPSRPVLVHRVDLPDDAQTSKDDNVRGAVLLEGEVEPTGTISPESIVVLRGLGQALDRKAIECVRAWRFRPSFRNGYAVKARISVEISVPR